MTIRDPEPPPRKTAKPIQFDRFVLDFERGCLLFAGDEIALRPKTFAVLRHLVENSARLVSKDELFGAVWPGVAVTDDALVQSIGELRRALGSDGPRLIRTIPRRGYRFEADLIPVPPIPTPSDAGAALDRRTDPVAAPRAGSPLRGLRHGSLLAMTAAVLLVTILGIGLATGWRFQSGRAVLAGIEIGHKPAIAVLPFQNEKDDASREYFADGLTQDIINALGRFSELTVMSWNAVLPYRGKPSSPGEIGRNLGVRYQVEGNARQAGDRVRVFAQLVDTDGRVLWSARFDEALADVFALQNDIAAQIARALPIRLTQLEQQRVSTKPTENLEAYDLVLHARPALQRPARAGIVEARSLLRHAIELDPNYAAAFAGLADTYFIGVAMGWAETPTEFLSRAEEMAKKALSIDDTEVRAHVTLGRIDIFYHRWKQARAEMDRALAINPNDAGGLAGRGNVLMWLGQTDAAIEALEQAQRIDPELSAIDRFALSLAYYLKQRYDPAIEQAELNLRETADANFSRVVLAAAYGETNRTEDAARVVSMIRRMDPTFDAQEFGTKFLNPLDLAHLRDGLRKAGLSLAEEAAPRSKQ
jgi:TolB-like protein/DNA-binding winged helix-turn-helix (wHTH) protein/cytochrome c-type biogenesis protein CcmH/NrfG